MANEPQKVIVEKSGNGALVAIIAVIAIALLAFVAFTMMQRENDKDSAIESAAHQVGDAAQDVGDAAQDAVRKVE